MFTGLLLLCDHAVVAEQKLYVNGGGWSQVLVPNVPVPMGLAIKILVPWDQSNMPHVVLLELRDEDGAPVMNPDGEPIRAQANLEVGRPPGLPHGTALDVPMAVNFAGIALAPGNYAWTLDVDDTEIARAPLRVVG